MLVARKQGSVGCNQCGAGAPLGRAIEEIATRAKCDVLIGVPGPYGVLLGEDRRENETARPI